MSHSSKTNFIRNIINCDLSRDKARLVTRFPPEPNGFLHIGHAKSIFLNFGLARYYTATCHLRFDDTNPVNEKIKYIKAIKDDIRWLGFDWGDKLFYASSYFDKMYELAVLLIKKGEAYVCDLSAQEVKEYRGTLTNPGENSPYRDRSITENLSLFERMKNGEFAEGSKTLRAKIDMSSGNINLRDPALYRIKFAYHPKTQDKWCIYPMYAFAHPLEDAIEKITHSLCTLEFQDQRPFYNWVIEKTEFSQLPKQIEFSRLNLNYTVTSKRKLRQLVAEKLVTDWNDPRMPTIQGMRRRGYTPESIGNFCDQIGISKQDSIIDMSILEDCIRNNLNQSSPRRNVIIEPLLVEIEDLKSADHTISVPNHPQNPDFGRRNVSISQHIYIEHDDFMEVLEKGCKKLSLHGRVRLMNGYVIECFDIEKDESGTPIKLKCRYFVESLGGKKTHDGIKPAGIIHWVDANNALDAEVRIYDRLFNLENPASLTDFTKAINPHSLLIKRAKVEASLSNAKQEDRFQFNRIGYFVADQYDHNENNLVFNRVVTLRSTWG